MRVTALIAFALLMPHASVGTAFQPAALGGLVIEDARINLTSTDPIEVQVRNIGKRTIVAWGVDATITDPNGVSRSTGKSIDGYEFEVRRLPDNPVLKPGATYTIRWKPTFTFEPVKVSAMPAFAIFDDDSAIGDERTIDGWFQLRARHAVAWQFIEETLDEARASATAPDGALRQIEAAINAAPKEIRDSFPCREVAQRLRAALRPGTAQAAGALFEELRGEAGARRKAATSRSVRRQ